MFKLKLIKFFSRTKLIPVVENDIKKLTNSLVSRYSKGNISLKKGNYLTQQDIKDKEKALFSHRFI